MGDKIMENLHLLEDYKNSEFYGKYKNKYYSDCILKEVFRGINKKHRLYMKNKTYSKIYEMNIQIMSDFLSLYYEKAKYQDNYMAWLMLYSIYIDPDPKGTRIFDKILCTADGLLSLKRIFSYKGPTRDLIEEYKQYRKDPIFYFPKEQNGINQSRASIFGDRIDYTLFDIKQYYKIYENCKMKFAYNLPKTSKWLDMMKNFKNIIDWFGIKGIFTNEKYEIYNLEKNDGSIITNYLPKYPWEWSDDYYNNIKQKIDEYYIRKSNL